MNPNEKQIRDTLDTTRDYFQKVRKEAVEKSFGNTVSIHTTHFLEIITIAERLLDIAEDSINRH